MNRWSRLAPKQRITTAIVIFTAAVALFATLYTRQRMNAAAVASYRTRPTKSEQTKLCAKGYYAPLINGRVQTGWCKEIVKDAHP